MNDSRKRLDMTTKMHSTLEHYFAATNRHDVAGMLADLVDDAVVKDEGREHRGVAAIREWMKETIRKYKFKAEPTSVAYENDRTAVAVTVSGDFPGSPIALTYWFKLEGQKIARLEIG
jgi:ketosteroid isomerase-like protein